MSEVTHLTCPPAFCILLRSSYRVGLWSFVNGIAVHFFRSGLYRHNTACGRTKKTLTAHFFIVNYAWLVKYETKWSRHKEMLTCLCSLYKICITFVLNIYFKKLRIQVLYLLCCHLNWQCTLCHLKPIHRQLWFHPSRWAS